VAVLNSSSLIGVMINNASVNVTGSLFLTLLGIVILLIGLSLFFRMPLPLTLSLIAPFLLISVLTAAGAQFLAIITIIIILLAIYWIKELFLF
jgi:hypothetical protein